MPVGLLDVSHKIYPPISKEVPKNPFLIRIKEIATYVMMCDVHMLSFHYFSSKGIGSVTFPATGPTSDQRN